MAPSVNGPTSSRLPADRMFARKLTLSLGRETVSLQPRLVELLVDSLRRLGSSDGDAVADEVSSLATAGIRIDLRLSAGELGALADAIYQINAPSRPVDPNFARLLTQLRERQAE
jgi:hypothetical protein